MSTCTAPAPMLSPAQAPSAGARRIAMLLKLVLLATLVVFAGDALAGKRMSGKKRATLERAQYDYSAAIRWGDFEGAWSMVDPEVRDKDPMTDVDFSRYEQIQVTSYRDMASQPRDDNTMMREIQIEVVNRHTLAVRKVRYTEIWRYDEEAKVWWIAGLPDFWQGR